MADFQRYIQIDVEGYVTFDGIRVADEDYGRELLQNLKMDERGVAHIFTDNQDVLVESFDDPLVVRTIDRKGDQFFARLPYNWEIAFSFETLSVDPWDRFHGRTEAGVPFVLSRAAQSQLFESVDEFDDDSLTIGGKKYFPGPWLIPNADINKPDFWTKIYKEEVPPWELGKEAAALSVILPQLKQPRSRVLILGAGSGHDAAFWARAGHIVTAVDFSTEAIEQAQKNYGTQKDLKFLQADIFKLPKEYHGQFDIVFEHTCYCAITPDRRNELVQVWLRCLAERGHLLGVFFTRDKPIGPPWGGSEWEIRERLKKNFDFRYWTRWHQSIPRRQGYELVVWAQKRALL